MNTSMEPAVSSLATSEAPSLSPFARAVAVFVRPTQAWGGLRERAQWWWPVLVTILLSMGMSAALHQRALLPMLTEQWEQQAADGQIPAEQLERMETFFSSPQGLAMMVAQQGVVLIIMQMLVALLGWFGAGFVLGTPMRVRWALEVAAWSGLVAIPGQLLAGGMAWMKETFRGVHTGFGMLLPEQDPPTKLMTALGVVLDSLGPLSIWYLAVAIIGAAALSGAPRKSVAWVLAGIYLAMTLFGAAMAGVFTPGS